VHGRVGRGYKLAKNPDVNWYVECVGEYFSLLATEIFDRIPLTRLYKNKDLEIE
jgi:hypothetical protein